MNDTDARRSIPVEQMRRWYQDECELSSIRRVCDLAGVGRTTLHKFVAGETMPHPRVRRLLGLYYMRHMGRSAIAPQREALDLLVSGLPDAYRDVTVRDVLGILSLAHVASGGQRPTWIDLLQGEDYGAEPAASGD